MKALDTFVKNGDLGLRNGDAGQDYPFITMFLR